MSIYIMHKIPIESANEVSKLNSAVKCERGQEIRRNLDTKIKDEYKTLITATEPLKLENKEPMVLSKPLEGNQWIAGNAPCNTSDHRRAMLVVHGNRYFAQRYAIDFIKVDKDGNSFKNDPSKNENYYAYNQNILSTAAGTVVDIKDSIPENVPHADKLAVDIDMETLGGNYVLVDHGNHQYAFYAHLIPGSITVKKGDTVQRGQVLGKLGNSGNSTEPHLHFHMVENPEIVAANGIPYVFASFEAKPTQLQELGKILKFKISELPLKQFSNQLGIRKYFNEFRTLRN